MVIGAISLHHRRTNEAKADDVKSAFWPKPGAGRFRWIGPSGVLKASQTRPDQRLELLFLRTLSFVGYELYMNILLFKFS